MAKRFTDSNKYKKRFFRNLPGAYKLLWDFLYHDCDNCGIWIVDFEFAQGYVGKDMPIDLKKALELFNADEERIVEIKEGEKWFLPGFIEFQYGHLSEKNRAHIPVISALGKLGLLNPDNSLKEKIKEDISSLQGGKDKAQEKDKDKDKDKEGEENQFSDCGFDPKALIPEMQQVFLDANPQYPRNKTFDYSALLTISRYVLEEAGVPGSDYGINKKLILKRWGELVPFIRGHKFFSTLSITQISNQYQSIIQSLVNGSQQSNVGKKSAATTGRSIEFDRP